MDDELGGCIGLVIAIGAALAVAFFAIWIALAAVVRVFSFVVVAELLVIVLGAALGFAIGAWTPFAVLSGRAPTTPVVLDPSKVAAGQVFRGEPRGPARHYGWDRAWPTYIPYQARKDARAVFDYALDRLRWAKEVAFGADPTISGGSGPRTFAYYGDDGWIWVGRLVLLGIPFLGFVVGLAVSVSLWFVVMAALGCAVALARVGFLYLYRARDRVTLNRNKATLYCDICLTESKTPSYDCSNDDCDIVHRDLRPGPQGVLARRCECGEDLPTTVSRAARVLAPRCPNCDHSQAEGAGSRQAVLVPLIGERSTGKTRFLASAVVGFEQLATDHEGELKGVREDGQRTIREYRQLIASGTNTTATSARVPIGLNLLLTLPQHRPVEFHFFDVAGEAFDDWESSAELRYLRQAPVLLFLIDPLAIRSVARVARRAGREQVAVAAGNFDRAYGSAMDPLRAEGIKLGKLNLGVVITKGDVLTEFRPYRHLASSGPMVLREWLRSVGLDQLVTRFDLDFGSVHYFLTDAQESTEVSDPMHPAHALNWVAEMNAVADLPWIKNAGQVLA